MIDTELKLNCIANERWRFGPQALCLYCVHVGILTSILKR